MAADISRPGTPDDEALQRELESLVAKPGDDPYELDWPDDAKELRAAERAAKAKAAAVKPVPRLFAATVISEVSGSGVESVSSVCAAAAPAANRAAPASRPRIEECIIDFLRLWVRQGRAGRLPRRNARSRYSCAAARR